MACTQCGGAIPPTALNCPRCGVQRPYPIAPYNPPAPQQPYPPPPQPQQPYAPPPQPQQPYPAPPRPATPQNPGPPRRGPNVAAPAQPGPQVQFPAPGAIADPGTQPQWPPGGPALGGNTMPNLGRVEPAPVSDPFNAGIELYGFLALYDSGRPSGTFWPLMGGEQTVGRVGAEPTPRIEVPDGTISSAHARFISAGGALHLEDLGSMNGTWLNDEKLAPGDVRILGDGDHVRFGATPLIVKLLPRS